MFSVTIIRKRDAKNVVDKAVDNYFPVVMTDVVS